MYNTSILSILFVLLVSLIVPKAFGITPSFQGIGDLSGGEFSSYSNNVSDDGLAVVGTSISSTSGPYGEAYRWKAGNMLGLGDMPGGPYGSQGRAVSNNGDVVVGSASSESNAAEAFRWTLAEGMVSLFNEGQTSSWSTASDVSSNGAVIVGRYKPMGSQAFRWTAEEGIASLYQVLPSGSVPTSANAVSADGSVIVGTCHFSSGASEPFRWTQSEGAVSLGNFPDGGAFTGVAGDVSSDGKVIVGVGDSALGIEAFRWTSDGGMVGLGDLPGGDFESWASGVSGNGR